MNNRCHGIVIPLGAGVLAILELTACGSDVLIASPASEGEAQEAQTGLGHKGRWFTKDGQPTFLVGFDCQELAADPTINYVAALDAFAAYRMNKVRLWVDVWFGASFGALTPWARNSSGQHDLDRWNPAYWDRLRDFVAQARARNIVVELSVFAPYPAGTWWWSSNDFRVAWNRAYNVNGAFSSNGSGHFQPQFFDLTYAERSQSGKTLADYQQALVDKTVAEVGSFDNVYFEVCNEFGVSGLDVNRWGGWQSHWADRIDAQTSQLAGVHAGDGSANGANQAYAADPAIDVLNLRFDFGISPRQLSDRLHAAQAWGKILSVNETHSTASGGAGATDFYGNLDAETNYAWGLLMSGAHTGFYVDDSSFIGSAGWQAGAARLRALRDIVEKVRFWELSPVDATNNEYDGLVTQGPGAGGWQVLAKPGSEVLVYFWGSPSTSSVRMALASGPQRYEWYDSRNAALLASGTVNGSASTTIAAPPTTWSATTGVVLLVRADARECASVGVCCAQNETCGGGTAEPTLDCERCCTGGGACEPVDLPAEPADDARAPVGWLDSVAGGVASGWACDQDEPVAQIVVHLYVGGPAGSGATGYGVTANRGSEAAINSICGGGSAHRFSFPIPGWEARAGQAVFAYGINTGAGGNSVLEGSPKEIPAPSSMPTAPPTATLHDPVGFLDGVQNGAAAGWACDQDAPSAQIAVHLYVGGPAGSGAPGYAVTANQSSETAVSTICGGGNAHRYRFTIPGWESRRGQAVYAYGINTGAGENALLSGSPKPVN